MVNSKPPSQQARAAGLIPSLAVPLRKLIAAGQHIDRATYRKIMQAGDTGGGFSPMGVIRKSVPVLGRRGQRRVECLFDTGASSSFIRPMLVRTLGLSTADLPKPLRIRLGKGSTQVSRIAAVMIRLNGATLADTAYVMPGLSEDYVLGAEFLERYDIRLDPKRRRLLLPSRRRLSLILV